jgi:TPR repeat protein
MVPQVTFAVEDDVLFQQVKSLAENGNSEAAYHLGMLYNNGIGSTKDINSAFKWFNVSANSGDPLGHYKVGCYLGDNSRILKKLTKKSR